MPDPVPAAAARPFPRPVAEDLLEAERLGQQCGGGLGIDDQRPAADDVDPPTRSIVPEGDLDIDPVRTSNEIGRPAGTTWSVGGVGVAGSEERDAANSASEGMWIASQW